MSNNINDDSWCIGVIAFIVLWVAWDRWLDNYVDALIISVFITFIGYWTYRIIKYVWRG